MHSQEKAEAPWRVQLRNTRVLEGVVFQGTWPVLMHLFRIFPPPPKFAHLAGHGSSILTTAAALRLLGPLSWGSRPNRTDAL